MGVADLIPGISGGTVALLLGIYSDFINSVKSFNTNSIVYIINLLLGDPANFWYLMDRPAGASLMDQFPDPPLHLLYTTPIAIALFYLIYLPYFIKDRIAK